MNFIENTRFHYPSDSLLYNPLDTLLDPYVKTNVKISTDMDQGGYLKCWLKHFRYPTGSMSIVNLKISADMDRVGYLKGWPKPFRYPTGSM